MARLSDKVNVFRNMTYIDKEGEEKRITMEDIGLASTSDMKYPINQEILDASIKGPKGRGIFVADPISTDELLEMVDDRKFPFDIINALREAESKYSGQLLRETEQ